VSRIKGVTYRDRDKGMIIMSEEGKYGKKEIRF
jgi:hypothetical protein